MKTINIFALYLVFCSLLWACSDPKEPEIIPPVVTPPVGMAQLRDGITKISDDSLAFVLFAPNKQTVHLIGDFNNWQANDASKMTKAGDRFYKKVGQLVKGKEYVCQYLIDGTIYVADPYADKISDPWSDKNIPQTIYPGLIAHPSDKTKEIAMVVNTNREVYPWKVDRFKIANPEDMVIYELLIRDFTKEGGIRAAREKIPYLKALGVNSIELMPFNEFDANDSWGYNPTFYFAADKAYGTSDDYKAFIDECHQNGMAVIMDMVLNHSYGQSPLVRMYQVADGKPAADNPWYNAKSNFANPGASWGADFNHESPYTKLFVDSVCSYWMSEYKVDGFRFDFTKGFSNTPHPATGPDDWGSLYDPSRINNLKRIYDAIKKRNPDALMICEHLAENREEMELANYGIMLWGNMNYNFNEATMGWLTNSNVDWTSYSLRGWQKPNLIAYMESHDEERLMVKNLKYGNSFGNYTVKDLPTALKRNEAAAVILLSFPGPKMIWQFGELGYDFALQDGGADRLAKKPVHWEYYDDANRRSLYNTFASMNQLRNTHPAFSSKNEAVNMGGGVKQILLKSPQGDVCVMANFEIKPVSEQIQFSKTGRWQEYFTKSLIDLTTVNTTIQLQPGEYRVYLSE